MAISYVPVDYDPFGEATRRASPVPGLPEQDERFVQIPEAIKTTLPGTQVSFQAGQMPQPAGVSYEPVDYDPWETDAAPAGPPDPDAPAGPRANITPETEEDEEWTPPTWESLWESFKTTKVYATPEPEYMKQRYKGGLINVELAGLETLNRDRGETPERDARVAQLEAQLKEMGLHEDNRALLEIGVGFVAEQIPIQTQILKGGLVRGAQGAMIGGVTGTVAPGLGTLAGAAGGGRIGMAVGVAEQAYYLEGGLAYNELKKLRDDAGKPIQREVAVWASRGVGATNAAIEVLQIKTALRFIPGGERLLRRIQTETAKKLVKNKGFRKILTNFGKKLAKFTGIETAQETTQEIVTVTAEEYAKALENDLRGANFKLATEDKETLYNAVGQILTVARDTALGMGLTGVAGGVTIGAGQVAVKTVKGKREIEKPAPETDLTDEERETAIISSIQGRVAKGEISESQFGELEGQFPKGTPIGNALREIRGEQKVKTEPIQLTDQVKEDEPIPLEDEVFAGTEKAMGVRLAGDELTGQMRESAGIPLPDAYPELANVSAEEAAAVFAKFDSRKKSIMQLAELKEELRARSDFEEVYGIEGLAGYLVQVEDMVRRGEPGGRFRVKDELGAGETWYGYSSTYPEFMVNNYGKKETLAVLKKGLIGAPLTPKQEGIWEAAREYAADMRSQDLVAFGQMVEESPQDIQDLSDIDYKMLLEGLQDEGYSTRDIEEAAARYRGTIEEAVIREIAEESGVTAGEIESLIQQDPDLNLGDIYNEAVAAEYLAMPPSGEEEINAQRLRENERRLSERRAAVEAGEIEGGADLELEAPEEARDEEALEKELPDRVDEIQWDRWTSGAEEAAAIPGEPIWFYDADDALENFAAAVSQPYEAATEPILEEDQYLALTPDGTAIKPVDQPTEFFDSVEAAMIAAQDWVEEETGEPTIPGQELPASAEQAAEHHFNFPTVPSTEGNLLTLSTDGIVYESVESKTLPEMLEEFDLPMEDVQAFGFVDTNGVYLWNEEIEEPAELPEIEVLGPAEEEAEVEEPAVEEGLIKVPGTDIVTKLLTEEDVTEYFKRYGVPSAIDVGHGPFGKYTGRLFVDEDTGEGVGYVPAPEKPAVEEERPGATEQRAIEGIKKAIEEMPSRQTHGHTHKNAFFITETGEIIARNKWEGLEGSTDVIDVHSHGGENWREYIGRVGKEVWDSFNSGDLQATKWLIKKGFGNKYVVLMPDGRFDYLEIPPEAQEKYLKLGQKGFENKITASMERRNKNWDEKKIPGAETNRMQFREFAEEYGLIFKEDLMWTDEYTDLLVEKERAPVPLEEYTAEEKAQAENEWDNELTKAGKYDLLKRLGWSDKDAQRINKVLWHFLGNKIKDRLLKNRDAWVTPAEAPEAAPAEAPEIRWKNYLASLTDKAKEAVDYLIPAGTPRNVDREIRYIEKALEAWPTKEKFKTPEAPAAPAEEIGDLGTPGAWNIPNLSEFFLGFVVANVKMNKVLIQKNVADALKTTRAEMIADPAFSHKPLEEAFEYAIVQRARQIIADVLKDTSQPANLKGRFTFYALKKLYESQPSFSTRTSKSMIKQAYSTPVHLAYLMQLFTGVTPKTWVYEPTAGTGMLLTSTEPASTWANELDADRLIILKDQNFLTSEADATDNISREKGPSPNVFDIVLANPPFGSQNIKRIEGYKIAKLEHEIMMDALKAMKPDGKAAFIIGGMNFREGNMIGPDKIFFNWLYSNYNVELNADIPGKEYGRQGTTFPVRLLVVNGRKAVPSGFAPTEQSAYQKVESIDDLIPELRRIENERLAAPRAPTIQQGPISPGGLAGEAPQPQPPAVPEPLEGEGPAAPGEGPPTTPPGPAPRPPAEGGGIAGGLAPEGPTGVGPGVGGLPPTITTGAGALPAGEGELGPGEREPEPGERGPGPREPTRVPEGVKPTKPKPVPGVGDLDAEIQAASEEDIDDLFKEIAGEMEGEEQEHPAPPQLDTTAPDIPPEEEYPFKMPSEIGRIPVNTFLSWWDEKSKGRRKPKTKVTSVKDEEGMRRLTVSDPYDFPFIDAEKARQAAKGWDFYREEAGGDVHVFVFKKGKAPPKPPKLPKPPKIKDIADELKAGAADALTGLDALFGDPNTLRSGVTFDEETYQKAKPFFKKAYDHALQAGYNLKQYVKYIVERYGTRIYPYVKKFITELKEKKGRRKDKKPDKIESTQWQVEYRPKSLGPIIDETLVPKNMRDAVERALDRLENEVGQIDDYVVKKLQLRDREELWSELAADQVDGTALAIWNMEKGDGMIIGDQTGVGKGRIAAALWHWAQIEGKKPIFMTAKANLFTDFYRDIVDTGQTFNPMIMASDATEAKILQKDKKTVFQKLLSKPKREALYNAMASEGTEGLGEHDGIVATYSQVQQPNLQQNALFRAAVDNYALLDESHLASGAESATGDFMRNMLGHVKGVTFLSATFAKRANTMPLYFRTGLSKANMTMEELIKAINDGGTPLQEIISAALAELGQMIRRERSFRGIQSFSYVDTKNKKRDEARIDVMTVLMRDILAMDTKVGEAIAIALRNARRSGRRGGDQTVFGIPIPGSVTVQGGSNLNTSVTRADFSSNAHNAVRQLLLCIKCDLAVEKAVTAIKERSHIEKRKDGTYHIVNEDGRVVMPPLDEPGFDKKMAKMNVAPEGRKPFITLDNTMGSFVNWKIQEGELELDGPFEISYATVLKRNLDRALTILVEDPYGNKQTYKIDVEHPDFPRVLRDKYYNTIERIEGDVSGIPGSPIDYIKSEMQKRGYSVGEITGRKIRADITDPDNWILRRIAHKDPTEADRKKENFTEPLIVPTKTETLDMYNNGQYDALVMNRSASTGVSAHASPETGTDLRPREVNSVQAQLNVDDEMQLYGRPNRKGQVVNPSYINLYSDTPAETRPASVIIRKMISLNANTAANPDSPLSERIMPDLNNKYGNRIVRQWVKNNRQLAGEMQVDVFDSYIKVSGKIALQPVTVQRDFFEEVELEYSSLEEELKEQGLWDLEIQDIDFQAETLQSAMLTVGVDEDHPLGKSTFMEKQSVINPTKPFRKEQVERLVDDTLKGSTGEQFSNKLLDKIEKLKDAFILEKQEDAIANEQEYDDTPVRQSWDFLNRQLKYHAHVGNTFNITLGDEFLPMVGVLLNIKHQEAAGSPTALSRTRLTFAVNNSLRRVTIPLSKLESGASSIADYQEGILDTWDEITTKDLRANRYMITGNLVQGAKDMTQGARFIRFTRKGDKKTWHWGILMPMNYDPIEAVGEVRIKTDQAIEALESGVEVQGNLARVNIVREGRYRIQLPPSKKVAGRYFLDEELMSHMENEQFEKINQTMRGIIKPGEAELDAAMNRLFQLGESFSIPRSDYDRLFGEAAPETQLMVGEQNPQAANPDQPETISYNDLEKSRTVAKLFPQWMRKAGMPEEVIEGIRLRLQPLIKLTDDEMAKSKAQWSELGYPIKKILGATTFDSLFATVQLAMNLQNVQDIEATTYHEAYHIAKKFLMPTEAINTIKRMFKNEEAEANAFRDFMITRKVQNVKDVGALHRLWLQLRRLLSIVRSGLNGKGFARPEDIFGQIMVGAYSPNVRMTAVQDPVTVMSIENTDPYKQWADNLIEDAMKKASSEKAKRITAEQDYFDKGEYQNDVFNTAKGWVKALKFGQEKGWVKDKPDTTVLERLLQSPEFYFKKVNAAWRVFNAGLDRVDDYHHYYNQVTADESLLTTMAQLQKDRKKEYKRLSNLIVHADRNKIKYSPELLKHKGYSDQAINAWIAFRQMMDNGFNILFADMTKIISKYEEAGMPIPEVATWVGDKKVKINLKVALARMGEMKGYYAPRSRKAGRYQLIAKKEGSNPVLEYYDTKTFMNRRADALEKEGYTITLSKSRPMPEDVFEIAGRTVGLQAMVNRALDKAITKDEINLATFGVEGKWEGATYVLEGPTSVKMNKVIKNLGGKYPRGKKGEARRWVFYEATEDIESRLIQGLAANVKMPGAAETDLLFAEALATQVANIVKGRGFRSAMIKRGPEEAEAVWIGYELDPLKGASQYVTGLAGGMAKKNMASKMVKAVTGTDVDRTDYESAEAYMDAVKERRIDPEKQPNIFKDVMSYMNEMLRNQEFADRVIGTIKGLTVLKYLGFRLSAPLVNLTALATSVPPSMAAHAGVKLGDVPKYLVKAMTAYGQYKWGDRSRLDTDTIQALDAIHNNNWHSAQYNQEALAVLRNKWGGGLQKLMNWSMLMFGATEQLNRISTILGTYMALRDQGQIDQKAMLQTAKHTSDRSHGIYGKTTLPYLAHGSNPFAQAAKSFYVFSKFSHTYLQNMYEIGFKKKDRMGLLYMAIAPAILSGGAAVPLIGPAMMSAIGQLFKGFGDDRPEEGEEAVYAWIDENLGTMTSDFARFGLIGLGGKGVSLKGSLQIDIGGSVPSSIPEMFGAPGNVLMDVWQGGRSVLKGDIYRGLERAGPRFTGSILQGVREYRHGVTTYRNVPKFLNEKQMQPDFPDTILRVLNFNPAGVAKMKEMKWAQTKLIQKYRQKRSDIYNRMRAYYQKAPSNRTEPAYNDILADIYEYNSTVKRNRLHGIKGISLITRESINQSLRLKR